MLSWHSHQDTRRASRRTHAGWTNGARSQSSILKGEVNMVSKKKYVARVLAGLLPTIGVGAVAACGALDEPSDARPPERTGVVAQGLTNPYTYGSTSYALYYGTATADIAALVTAKPSFI